QPNPAAASRQLQIPPSTTANTFAFNSVPPINAMVGHPYQYTALASGPGISSVVYSVSAGPTSFSIDGSTGVVSYTPGRFDLGTKLVAIVANGGGVEVYQVYQLTVIGPYNTLDFNEADQIDGDGGVVWAAENYSGVTRIGS